MADYFILIYEHFIFQFLLAIIIAYLSVVIIQIVVHRFFERTSFLTEKREKTLESMISSIAKYAASTGVIIFGLSYFFPIGNLLAGAGVIGIIVGFGAQSLIKDILSGITLLYEKQLHKGDFITVNNEYSGTVEEIGLRMLKIRQWSGKLLTIRNGEVNELLNFNMNKMRVIEKVTTSFQENPTNVMEVLEKACQQLNIEYADYLLRTDAGEPIEKFQVYGMTSLNKNFHGYEYTIIGLVQDYIYFTAAKKARLTIAQHLYDANILMAEENIRLKDINTKKTAYDS